MTFKKSLMTLVLLCLAILPGLSVDAQSERLQIVASFSILADVVSNVAGDAADVTSLIPVGNDPHSFMPSPRDIVAVAEADVVFINGANFEELLLEAIENAGGDANMVEVSSCVEILPTGAGGHDHEGEDHAEEDHAEKEGESEVAMKPESEIDAALAALCEAHHSEMDALHEASHDHEHEGEGERDAHKHDHEGEGHDHAKPLGMLYALECGHHEHEDEAKSDHEHEHGGCDPHVWTEPHNVIFWTFIIRDTLIALDAANADTYTANAAAYAAQLDELAHDFVKPMMESVPQEARILVTNHETLGYLAAAYDYEIVGTVIPGGGTANEPSAADIAALIDLIKAEGVRAIFAENTVTANIAEQVAAESGANFYVLFSDSLTDADGAGATYIDYVRYNVTTIVTALGGGM